MATLLRSCAIVATLGSAAATTCDPAACTAVACGYCLVLLDESECPGSARVQQGLQSCEAGDVAAGELCEGSGDCGTSEAQDNCL